MTTKSPSCRRARAWCSLLLVAGLAAASLSVSAAELGPATPAAASASVVPAAGEARVIVKYKADSSLMRALSSGNAGNTASTAGSSAAAPQHAQALGLRLGIALTDGLPVGPSAQVVKASGMNSAELAARLSAQGDVDYAVVDQRVRIAAVPNDPLLGPQTTLTPAAGQWYLRTPGVDGQVSSINAPAAWNLTTGLASTVVAVIDTGITTHPDLAGKVLPGYDFISDAATAADGDGRDADPTDPGDGLMSGQLSSITGCSSSNVGPSSWHGTQTAGLIGAATNNGVGLASIGWNVMLLPLRVLGKCGGTESDVIAAIRWAVGGSVPGVPVNTHPAKVINLSLGGASGTACDAAYQDAVSFAISQGAVVVAAAGNDGLALGSPANCTGAVAVAGVRHLGTKVGYSDLGPGVTLAAPAGNCVNGTGQTCLFPLVTTSNDGSYTVGNPVYTDGDVRPSLGTSFSAPLVAGTVALMFSVNPGLTPAQVNSFLRGATRPFVASGSAPLLSSSSSSVTAGASVNLTGTPIAACTAPTGTAQSTECYCTTATCGSGLLDAGAAVSAAAGITPVGTPPESGPLAATISYQWTIANVTGSASAIFNGFTNQATVSVVTGGVGTFTAILTTTDSLNQVRSAGVTVSVIAPVATPTPPPTSTPAPTTGSATVTSNSSGGGALSSWWLIGLLGAVVVLFGVNERQRR